MDDVAVIEDPAAAEVSLDPIRSRLLAELAVPGSATMLAGKVGLPRQKVNYHLRTLEHHGLVKLVEERRKGNVTERMLQATAASYVISPSAMAALAARACESSLFVGNFFLSPLRMGRSSVWPSTATLYSGKSFRIAPTCLSASAPAGLS